LTPRTRRLVRYACPIAALALGSLAPSSARADFFDDMRRTFQTDIPHFFQDDIPCAFGGRPTSGTKTSCKSSDHPAKPAVKPPNPAPPREKPGAVPNSGQ
jgi:hypothetical protein